MNNTSNYFDKAILFLKNSVMLKLIVIGIMILFLLIPVSMVQDLIRERENRKEDAIREVSSKWGNPQTITGLVLSIPYFQQSKIYDEKSDKYKLVTSKEYAHFLPETLNITGNLSPEIRYRGIYEVILYNTNLNITGFFNSPNFTDWKISEKDIIWDEAYISLGISDLRGIQDKAVLNWDNNPLEFNPGLTSNDVIQNGISCKIPKIEMDSLNPNTAFSLDLNLNGSSNLNFIPVGKTTSINLESSWATPSFDGAFLPDERTVDENGFNAKWSVLHLNRPYPQSFKGTAYGMNETSFGVNLLLPIDEYQKSMRSAKYAVLFIALTFLLFFFVQILNRIRIHPIQYMIVGLALCVFYTLLIALSEHITFMLSYLISSISIVTMITLYAHNFSNNKRITAVVGLILTILYLFIYTILQIQDYALLIGSIGLFITLAIVMYLSRKIDWYSINGSDESIQKV